MTTRRRPECGRSPRVLIAVRHPVMRRYAVELLRRDCACWTAHQVASAEMLPAAIRRVRPDVLVVDAGEFPACCRAAIDAFPAAQVVVIGREPDPGYRAAAAAGGAAAYVSREDVADQLAGTIRAMVGCGHHAGGPPRRAAPTAEH